ncbi:unnamed protein product [Cylindrotheca closterium]|uniref:Uncharacterized protein n=1 Tax=Cylindrotheca closterium TaxID=2856 RepID=A0AAD2FQQ9_9STRA|nr:unnamed protein product [Cylindrotheca closterium]
MFPKGSKLRHKGSSSKHWSSFQGNQDRKLSQLEASRYHQSKKFYKMHHEAMTFDKSEELLRLHQIKAALQEEKLSNSSNKVKSWRSSSSSSSSSDDPSSLSSSSSFDCHGQEEVQQDVEEDATANVAHQEAVASRMEKETPNFKRH